MSIHRKTDSPAEHSKPEIANGGGNSNLEGPGLLKALSGSLILASILFLMDVVFWGGFIDAFGVVPIWLLVAIIRALRRRSLWRLALARILIPLVTAGIVFGNASIQSRIGRRNAGLIMEACEHYRAANGVYPAKLSDLVPKYLHSIPPARYSLALGEFTYTSGQDGHWLMWVETPPLGRPFYDFEKARWGYLD